MNEHLPLPHKVKEKTKTLKRNLQKLKQQRKLLNLSKLNNLSSKMKGLNPTSRTLKPGPQISLTDKKILLRIRILRLKETV